MMDLKGTPSPPKKKVGRKFVAAHLLIFSYLSYLKRLNILCLLKLQKKCFVQI